MVAMLIRDALRHHFQKGCSMEGWAVVHSYVLCTHANVQNPSNGGGYGCSTAKGLDVSLVWVHAHQLF